MKGFFSLSIQNEKGESEYELSEWDGRQYWLKNKLGEGMEITSDQLFDLFDKYFRENF